MDPLFIQLLSLTRNNAYHVHKEDALKKKKIPSHKLLDMIKTLLQNAHMHRKLEEELLTCPIGHRCFIHYNQKRQIERESQELVEEMGNLSLPSQKRAKVSHFFRQFSTNVNHEQVSVKKRGMCVICSEEYQLKKIACYENDEDLPDYDKEVTKTPIICGGYSSNEHRCYLCKKHFRLFHGKDKEASTIG